VFGIQTDVSGGDFQAFCRETVSQSRVKTKGKKNTDFNINTEYLLLF